MSRVDQRSRTLSAILILVTSLLSGAAGCQSELSGEAQEKLKKIATVYKIEIVTVAPRFPVKTTYGKINGKSADRKSLESFAVLFATEFSLYPPELVKRSWLKRVVFCTDLSLAGQQSGALADLEHYTLYLECIRGALGKRFLRRSIHHEFFHLIDYRDDGSVYQDKSWEYLNPRDFKYGSGGYSAQDLPETAVLTDKFSGFLNHYSTTGVEEDKAEVFAHLVVNPDYVEDRAKEDHVLKAKVERMRDLLISFCPDMDEEFWEKVRKVKRSDE